jgi:tetratricopeptide (TPR) repeat protein
MVRTETPVHPKGTNHLFPKVGKGVLGVCLVVVFGFLPLTAWAETFPGKGSRAKWEEAARYSKTGIRQAQAGDYKAAKASLEKAILIYDQDAAFYYNLGLVCKKLNLLDQTELNNKRALGINPTYGKAWIGLGNSYNDQNKIHDALNAYKSARNCNLNATDKANVDSVIEKLESTLATLRAEDSYKQGKYDKSLIDLDKAIGLDSKNGEAYYLRGKVNEKLGKTSEAQSDFARSKELDYKPKQGE